MPDTERLRAQMNRRWKFALAALIAACVVVAAHFLLGERGPKVESAPGATGISPQVRSPASTATGPASGQLERPAAAATAVPTFDQRNLYAEFQAALGSSDRRTLERGLGAWRTCAGYVHLGVSDIESWLQTVMPEDLSRDEWNRRAVYARASAARCAGFAMQTDALDQAERLKKRAVAAGSTSERLREALPGLAEPHAALREVFELSCMVVGEYPDSPSAIRLVTPAIRRAARARESHMLNQTPLPELDLAINLALCDLDPQSCDAHSNVVRSACTQSGKCDYINEVDFWKGESSPERFAAAQGPRRAIVSAIGRKDCGALFQ
jgi:hypothetical protein